MPIKYIETQYTVSDAVESAASELSSLRDELQDWLDGMPENLQQGSKAEELQTAIDGLEEAVNDLESLTIEDAANATFVERKRPIARSRYLSRRMRRDDATALLSLAVDAVRERESDRTDEQRAATDAFDFDEVANAIESAKDTADNVEFPGMR